MSFIYQSLLLLLANTPTLPFLPDSPQVTEACDCIAQPEYDEDKCREPCDATFQHPPQVCGYNAAELFNPCSPTNLYVTGSYIYYRASADYLAEAFLDNSFSPNPGDVQNFIFNGKVIEPDFEYKSGYKVGLGYKIHRDRWDLYAEYTRFHQKVHNFKEVNPDGQHMHVIWVTFINPILLNDEFRSVSSIWTTNFDIVDAEVGRNFFCGRYLTLRPSLGLRSLWLEQKYNLTYVSLVQGINVDSFNKSNSWGIGPRFALKNTWNLCGGFKILGDLGVSLLHVEDHISVKQINPIINGISDNITYKNKESITTIKPILDLSLGLGWGHPFFRDKCSFDLLVSYDYSLYWQQGSIQLGHAPLVAPGSPLQVVVGQTAGSTGNLSVEGLRVTARFDF